MKLISLIVVFTLLSLQLVSAIQERRNTQIGSAPSNGHPSSPHLSGSSSFRSLNRQVFSRTNGLVVQSLHESEETNSMKALLRDNRPQPSQRKFRSQAIEDEITNITSRMKDPYLAFLFQNCFPNTLDTTVDYTEDSLKKIYDTFVITGDIPAMWFRDSANQVLPYVPYATRDSHLKNMLAGVINRQVENILIDPYANSFNKGNDGSPHAESDSTYRLGFLNTQTDAMTLRIFERKYELDSILAVVKLSYAFWKTTGDSSPFQNHWKTAMRSIMDVIQAFQAGTDDGNSPYFFVRQTTVPTDTLVNGIGAPALKTGMSRSPFRPSDDATTYPYLVPANAMAFVQLTQLSEMFTALNSSSDANRASNLASQINQGIQKYAIVNHPVFGKIYAYETDGFQGSFNAMDDANVPSLLSLPYLGYCAKDDPLYVNTRKFLLSPYNPYFASGKAGEGIGSPHTGRGWIWPMSIIMRALTSNDDNEILNCLNTLKSSDAQTGFMHESFWKDDSGSYTRPWFSWANGMYGELILTLARERPYLIFK